jgi:Mce-associated membrane protein
MNPTLYDVLGVDRQASPETIKRAWKESAERFEPGSGSSGAQFRLFNEAAEVLLDPERRAAYDAELAAEAPAELAGVTAEEPAEELVLAGAGPSTVPSTGPSTGPSTVPSTGPSTGLPTVTAPIPGAAVASATVTTAAAQAAEPDEPEAEAAPEVEPEAEGEEPEAAARRGVPWLVLAVLGVVTVLLAGAATYLFLAAQRAEARQDALEQAPQAAERAAAAVLSYDHETIEADIKAAAKFLSGDYRKDYVDTMEMVSEQAAKTKATVEAEVLASAAMTTGGEDAKKVSVLLYVNQTTTSSVNSEPSVALNRVRLDMVEVDGSWLVAGITSY